MNKVILLIVSIFLCATTLIILVLYFIQKQKNKKYKEEIDKLEIEKNKLDSSPVIPELSKIESYLNNEKLEVMYNNWKNRLDVIRTNQIPKITDMLLDTDYSLSKMDYKKTLYKIARLEMEIYKVRTNSEFLLNEIKEITGSEERNRAIITKLKIKYRELYQKYKNTENEFGENSEVVELQFENIARKFEQFEDLMEKNEYTEVAPVVKSIDEMIKHMTNIVEELPGIELLAKSILPKKLEEVEQKYKKMTESGYPLDYLNVEYNIAEARNKINDILTRTKDLNIEDSLFELKVLLDYFESIFTDFEKEKVNRTDYENANKVFKTKYNKINNLLNDILKDIEEIKRLYNLSDIQLQELYSIKKDLDNLYNDYNILIKHTSNNTFAYSNKLIVGGQNIGIEVKTKGILVVGLYKVNDTLLASTSGIKKGDYIVKVNNNNINNISDFTKEIENDDDKKSIDIEYLRNNKSYKTVLDIAKVDNEFKTGLYVKDTISGIGTLTFIDPETKTFGALGHEILDKNSESELLIDNGSIYYSYITGITKSSNGTPGEKEAEVDSSKVFGTINDNTIKGIFGKYTGQLNNNLYDVAKVDEIRLGKAEIFTVTDGEKIEKYSINIEKINKDDETKNILFTIDDENLLNKTGGIVQGMSGSPIIQDNKIIGAVTHVIVDNCKKGYGIFITNMLEEAEN